VACPAKALREWLDVGGIESGPIFRPIDKGGTVRASRLTDRSVANIVKAYAERAGFDASTFSGHSLRAGFLTSAAGKGASIFKMMDVSRHKSVDTLRGYVRDAELFKDHAAISREYEHGNPPAVNSAVTLRSQRASGQASRACQWWEMDFCLIFAPWRLR
jgi:integrase